MSTKRYDEILKKINERKDEFIYDYSEELLSTTKLCEKYDICLNTLNKIIAHYGLERDNHAVKSKANSEVQNRDFEAIKARISKEELYEYYIEKNHSYYETAEHFGLKASTFGKLLRFYDIKQDRSRSFQKGLALRKERYGDDVMNTKKRKQTIIEKYGSKENFYEIRKEKAIATNRERYGRDWKATLNAVNRSGELYIALQYDKEASIKFLEELGYQPTFADLMSIFNCTSFCIYNWIERLQLSSYVKVNDTTYEDQMIEFLTSIGIPKESILHNTRKILDNQKEIDLYLPEYKVGIEMNGNYWHSSLNIKKDYHFKKSKEAEEKGIRIIHVYQYEWDDSIKKEIIKSIIKNALGKCENKIYARECEIKEIAENSLVAEFLNINHLQGYRNSRIKIGLFYNDELVEIMTFSNNKNYEWEIIRSASKINYQIIGGVSKLYAYFIKNYNPSEVFSYCDFNKFTGGGYIRLGMTFIGYTGPDMKWLLKNGQVISRHPEKHKEIKEVAAGEIYGAGNKKFYIKYR